MKNLVYFFLVVLVTLSSCKKEAQQDACVGIVCLNGGTCVDGICICDTGWAGADCSIKTIPMYSFIGNYHIVGSSHYAVMGQPSQPPVIIDTIIEITQTGFETLSLLNDNLPYTSADTARYKFSWYWSPHNYQTLYFRKPFIDDSVFYSAFDGGMPGGTSTNFSGIKIH